MQMELLKKPLKSYRTIDIMETEEMLENSIIVPDIKPDIKEIILADAECFVTNVEKTGRMIEVGGEIRYRIMYTSDTPEQRLESIVTQFSWSFSVQKPKTEAEIGVFTKSHCQHTEVSLVNGRKITARTVCSLNCRFYEIRTDEIGREILGENVYLKTTPVNVVSLKDNGIVTAKVSNILSLPHDSPAIKEVLFTRVNMGAAELSYGEDEPFLEAKGTAYILYRSDTIDEGIESVVLQYPIRMETGVESVAGGNIMTSSAIKSWEIGTIEDNDGLNTQVSIDMEIEVDAQNLIAEEQMLIEDAYAIGQRLDLKKSSMNVVTDEQELVNQLEVKNRIRIENPERQLAEVLLVCANERNIASKENENNIQVQGTIGVDILYVSMSKEVNSIFIEFPFSQNFDIPSMGRWQVVQTSFSIEDVNFDISGNDIIEVSVDLVIKLRLARVEEIVCTEAIDFTSEEVHKKAPIVLYFTQPGDSLWSIAKEYSTPVSKLALDNGLDASVKPEVGKKIFIM